MFTYLLTPIWVKFWMALHDVVAKIQNSASYKFCPTTHGIYVQRFINVGPAVSEP